MDTPTRFTVDVAGSASKEVKELLARLIAIADKENGFASFVDGTLAQTLLPGLELILATRMGDTFDPIIRHKMQYAMTSGPFVAALLLIPLKG